MTNSSRGVKNLILNKEGMKEKISYERRDYEAIADTPQSKTIYTLRKKGSLMVLQNGQRFYLEPFGIRTRAKDLQTMLGCEEP